MAMTDRDRRALIILGVIVVIAGAVGAFLLLSGDGGAPDDTAPTQVATPSPGTTPSPEPSPDVEEEEMERQPRLAFLPPGRDPFDPLIVEPTETTGTTNGETTNGTTTDGTTDGTTTDGETTDEGPAETGDSMTIGGKTITLIDIFTEGGEQKAQVSVDGETFVVGEGEEFAGNFKLVNVSGGCASFLFGDQSFSLCEPGERK